MYRILVSNEKVPLWKESSIRGIAYHAHLYTRIAAGRESDEVERWFEHEYETPAEEVLHKVTSNARLTSSDWRVLVRFVAAQDVRTPARLGEFMQRWYDKMPALLDSTLQEFVKILETSKAGEPLPHQNPSFVSDFPFRVTIDAKPGNELATVKAETIVGRGLWLFAAKHQLSKTATVLHEHRWTILSAPKGMKWFTSDDPVIRLNYSDPKNYNFGGGWGSNGTEIFMPLSPNYLLYTQVGRRPPSRGAQVSLDKARAIRRFIAEHAHRFIFAVDQDPHAPKLKPRTVSPSLLTDEKLQWSKWHEDQTSAEMKLMDDRPKAQEQDRKT